MSYFLYIYENTLVLSFYGIFNICRSFVCWPQRGDNVGEHWNGDNNSSVNKYSTVLYCPSEMPKTTGILCFGLADHIDRREKYELCYEYD